MKKSILSLIVLCLCVVLQAQTSKTITNLTAGSLIFEMTFDEFNSVTKLTLSGTMDARDFNTINQRMPAITEIDLTNVLIIEYTGAYGTVSMDKTYPANTLPDMALWGKNLITTIALPISITNIGNEAFRACKSLTSVNIPSSVISIGDKVFEDCDLLTSVTIPTSVISIGSNAFCNCLSLKSINIPASVITIGKGAFANCAAFINIDSENTNYSSFEGVLFNKDQTDLIQCPFTKTGDYTIPSSVKTINEEAFSKCWFLTSINIPNSVTTIGAKAFQYCSGIKSVTIPNSVTQIGEETFLKCTGLTSVTIPNSVTTIGDLAFGDCMSLTSLIIPDSVTTIGFRAFYGCKSLTSVSIPNSLTMIAKGAFTGCKSLTSLTIPNSVTTIGDDSFYYCSGLTSVVIPNSVNTIGDNAFFDCYSLTSLTIPNSVSGIGSRAFYGCYGLKSVTIPANVTSIGVYAFAYCASLATIYTYPLTPVVLPSSNVFIGVDKSTCRLHIPAGSLDLYKAADVWKDFIITDVNTSSDMGIKNQAITISPNPAKDVITIHTDEGMAAIYNSNGKLLITQSLKQNKQLNISSLKPGLYVVVVNGESLKIIKE